MKILSENTGLKPLQPQEKQITRGLSESLEAKKHRLRKATKEFESFFILHMLKAMRKTIPKSEMFNGGLGQDIYTSMFDEELSRKVAGNSPNSLSEMLYKSLEKHLEATAAESGSEPGRGLEVPTSIEDTRRIETSRFNQVPASPQPAKSVDMEEAAPVLPVEPPNIPKPKITSDPILNEFGPTIDKAARTYDVDSRLIYSVIVAESGGKPDAVSSKGAKGLMQLVDSTAVEMGVADSLDPHENIIGGTKYLRQLLDRYDGDLRLTLAAYNAGPGTVSKYNGVPPYPETRQYIENILGRLHSGKKP